MNTLENGVFRKTLLGLLEKAGNRNMCPVSKRSHRPISGLGHYGFPQVYENKYMDEDDPFAYKIDCILFAADDDCIASLNEYAKRKFHSLNDQYRKYIVGKSEQLKKQYSDIIAEESQRADFVCWLRNPPREKWSLCIPYEMSGETKATYPDFLIVRSDPALDYIIDILESHNPDFKDNLGKAKAFARYAEAEPRIGRIQLIRTGKDAAGKQRFKRLDLCLEITNMLRISRTAAYELVKKAEFAVIRSGGWIRVPRASFDAWLDGRGTR